MLKPEIQTCIRIPPADLEHVCFERAFVQYFTNLNSRSAIVVYYPSLSQECVLRKPVQGMRMPDNDVIKIRTENSVAVLAASCFKTPFSVSCLHFDTQTYSCSQTMKNCVSATAFENCVSGEKGISLAIESLVWSAGK